MANFTRKLTLGLFASALFAGPAMAQVETQPADLIGPTTIALEGGTDIQATPYQPSNFDAVIDSSIYYEDFRDGLAGWTFEKVNPTDSLLWEYLTKDSLSVRTGQARYSVFRSPTVRNGFMWFDYLEYSNLTPNPGPPYKNLIQTAVSPAVDLTAAQASNKYALFWYSYDPRLNIRNQQIKIVTPTDSAVIWTIPNFFDRPNTAPQRTLFARIPERFYGKTNVKFKFVYDGDFYGWAIDDIYIGLLPNNEVSLNDAFLAKVPNYVTPRSQTAGQNIYFVTDVQNRGANPQAPKVIVNIRRRLTATTSELYYTDSLQYPTIPADSVLENNVFEKFVGMPKQAGQYTVTYDVLVRGATDPDADLGNNRGSYTFFVEAGVDPVDYWKTPAFGGGSRPGDADGSNDYELGNIFYTPNMGTNGIRVDTVFGGVLPRDFGDTPGETFYEIRTYGYKGDKNNDGMPSFGDPGSDAEMILLGTRFLTIPARFPNRDTAFRLAPGEDNNLRPVPVTIPAGQGYIGYAVGISFVASQAQGTAPDRFFLGTNSQFDGGAAGLVRDSLVRRGIKQRGEEYNSYANFRSATPTPRTTYDPFGAISWAINTRITLLDSTSNVSNELLANEFALSPNPASTEINMSFDFGTTGKVTFVVTNGLGQQVMHLSEPTTAVGRVTIPVQSLNQGVYFVTAKAEDGATATRRVLIQR